MPHPPLLDALVGDATLAFWFDDAQDLAAMLAFESALAAAQAACGLLSDAAAAAIADACARFEPEWEGLRAGMATDGVIGPAFVAQLRATLEPAHRPFLHLAATSQDLVDTSVVLRLRPVATELALRLASVVQVLAGLRETQGDVALMGATRMQQALPITAADKLRTWSDPLVRHEQRLAALLPRLLVVQFGGPVGTRDGLDGKGAAVAAGMAARLGLSTAESWHTGRDRIVEFGQFCALLCGALGKIGQDVALLSQNEIASVRLAGGGRSSAMAHKANPVAAEMLVALARHTAGLSGTLAQALVHENERSGAAWTLEWLTLPPLVIATGAALRHAAAMLGGLAFVGR